MTSQDQVRNNLLSFSSQLKKLSSPTSPISVHLAHEVAAAFDLYLSGGASTLDQAFGLSRKKGRPPKIDEHVAISRRIFGMRFSEKSWKKVFDELSTQGCSVTDEKTLKEIYEKFGTVPILEEIDRQWNDEE